MFFCCCFFFQIYNFSTSENISVLPRKHVNLLHVGAGTNWLPVLVVESLPFALDVFCAELFALVVSENSLVRGAGRDPGRLPRSSARVPMRYEMPRLDGTLFFHAE